MEKKKKYLIGAAIVVVVIIMLIIICIPKIIENNKNQKAYDTAIALMEDGKYTEAMAEFEKIEAFKDSKDKLQKCYSLEQEDTYNQAVNLMKEEKFVEARVIFESLSEHYNYKDCEEKIEECNDGIKNLKYKDAISLYEKGLYKDAYLAFYNIGEYKESKDYTAKVLAKAPQYSYAGDMIYWGSYEQDGNLENGKEPICWYVVNIYEDEILLYAANVLDVKAYNEAGGKSGWANSSLRKWLNTEFYNASFTAEEKSLIMKDEHDSIDGTDSTEYVQLPHDDRYKNIKASKYAEAKGVLTKEGSPVYWGMFRRDDSEKTYTYCYKYKTESEWALQNTENIGVRPEITLKLGGDLKYTRIRTSNVKTKEKKPIPEIGMTPSEVKKTKWGYPDKINKNTYSWGTTEQWVYKTRGYVYFRNGKVDAVSER